MQGLMNSRICNYFPQQEQEPLQDVEQELPPPLIPLELKVEIFFFNLFDPQCGQVVPFVLVERTKISLSFLHFSQ